MAEVDYDKLTEPTEGEVEAEVAEEESQEEVQEEPKDEPKEESRSNERIRQLVDEKNELKTRVESLEKLQEEIVRRVADEVQREKDVHMEYLVGTMIEIPRAAITADQIATVAQFFSFGTNDLTQTTLGISRDDAGKFLGDYIEKGIWESDPFQRLDRNGVGELVRMGVKRGKEARGDLKIGICGEHGGEPTSIEFCHQIGMDYVSCSPFRVPIAILAAAQAALRDKE